MPESHANVDDPVQVLAARFAAAIAKVFPQAADADPLITPCKTPEHGDFQSNAAMGLAKRVGKKPREVAEAIVGAIDVADIAEPLTVANIAGPGFINVRLRPDALIAALQAFDTASLGVTPASPAQFVVVDLMGVNLAKQMHVGHLRSPVIGDAIARVLTRLGHTIKRQNHVGDWGLPIAMVIARLMREAAAGRISLDHITLDQLDEAYRKAQSECQRDMAGLEAARRFGMGPKAIAELEEQVAGATEAFLAARQTLIKLQAMDPETHGVWKRVQDVTMKVCIDVCRQLRVNVTDADSAGESSYAPELAAMVDDLVTRGVAEVSDGALVVRLEDPQYGGIKEPCLIRKTDGGYLYATTDVCAIRRRVQKFGAERIIYSIDARQNLHLRQVFGASIKAGYAIHPRTHAPARMEHAAFGSVMGEDGKPFKTRSGESVKLSDLIEETFTRAAEAVRKGNPELPAGEAREIAEAVGVAALKYADLSTDRVKDYIFSFDRMLAFEGNTGPYLLYALVRIKSIFRKAAERGVGETWKTTPHAATAPAEKQLALALLRYPAALRATGEALEPHRLCTYLYELAGVFSTFFEQCPVLKDGHEATRDSRLRLCDLAAKVLADGLSVLGIPAIERM
ncbi:MAG: arginine--tRNA ligase [Tepidisphaera sp.]|nr:arginine--tRNA ligase [Tepidisphaera sp.]